MNKYKLEIEKMASSEIYNENGKDNLRVYEGGDSFYLNNYLPIHGEEDEADDDFDHEKYENLINKANDFYKKSPLSEQVINDMNFNKEREKIKSKLGTPAFAAINAIPAATTLGLNLAYKKKFGSGLTKKNIATLMGLGQIVALDSGAIAKYKLNERKRDKLVGPGRYENENKLENELHDYLMRTKGE